MGGRSGSMMWPGGEFAYGNRSNTYTTAYKPDAKPRDKVDTVMRWLTSADQPANLVMLYFDEPDLMGHVHSPESQVVSAGSWFIDDSGMGGDVWEGISDAQLMLFYTCLISILPPRPPQTLDMIRQTDDTVAYIQSQLDHHQLLATTNVIYLSDHGMSAVGSPHFINLSALLPPGATHSADMYGGSPVMQIVPRDVDADAVLRQLRAGAAANGHFAVYTVDELPERWHLQRSGRLGPIVAVAAEGWAFEDMFETAAYYERTYNVTRSPQRLYGIHGYDSADEAMRATFVASGPAFRTGQTDELAGFDNVELFALFWRLLGYPLAAMPANNGTRYGGMVWEKALQRAADRKGEPRNWLSYWLFF